MNVIYKIKLINIQLEIEVLCPHTVQGSRIIMKQITNLSFHIGPEQVSLLHPLPLVKMTRFTYHLPMKRKASKRAASHTHAHAHTHTHTHTYTNTQKSSSAI